MPRLRLTATTLACLTAAALIGCGHASAPPVETPVSEQAQGSSTTLTDDFRDTDLGYEVALAGSMELSHARRFTIDYLADGTSLICVADGARYLVTDAGYVCDPRLAQDVTVIERPLHDVYLVASDTMCAFDALGSLDAITVSGLERDSWHVDGARAAMDAGKVVYGGKYRSPDYELLLAKGVSLAVESSMINHAPEVKDKLEELGISVFCELSSYEADPLGRLEWIRLWGHLLDKDEEAEAVFRREAQKVAEASAEPLDVSVAFFSLNANGAAVVRRPGDYVTAMIELAGGTSAFSGLGESQVGSTSMTLDQERFFSCVRDADIIVYNKTIDGSVETLDDLVERSDVLASAKAVEQGTVWMTSEDMYQQMVHTGQVVSDLHQAFLGTTDDLTYLKRLDWRDATP